MRVQNDPCADGRTATETDWLAILLALAAVIYSGAHYIGYEFEYIHHFFHIARSPYVSTTGAILQRLALDLIRVVLTVLGIILFLVLECKNAISSFSRRFRNESVVGPLGESTSAIKWMSLRYDAASHSHRANATRQGIRAARAQIGTLLGWGIPVAAVLILLHGPPVDTDSLSTGKSEVRPYVVPAWVIRARPENRYYDRSNNHYTPSDEWLVFDQEHNPGIQSLELQSAGLQSSSIVLSSNVERTDNPEGALAALKSENNRLDSESESQGTAIIAHIPTAWQTRTETETRTTIIELSFTETLVLHGTEGESTITKPSHDVTYRYCSVCRQKHCCSFP
jgi:hypothetical protein